jgi:hypothetical protein
MEAALARMLTGEYASRFPGRNPLATSGAEMITTRLPRRHILFLFALTALAGLAPPVRADLRFTQPVVDAGEVRRGPALVQRFPFVNVGSGAVAITDAKGSCGCLKPRFSKQQLNAGEEGWLEMEVNTLSQPAGPNTWRIQVVYRDGEQTVETSVQLSARLIAEIDVEPAAINIVCGPHSSLVRNIEIIDRRARPLGITSVQVSSPHLLVEDKYHPWNVVETGCHTLIPLYIRPEYPEGKHDEVVSIFTDDPAYRELKVPVTILKHARLRVSVAPDQVTFEGKVGDPLPSRIVLVRDADDQPVAIEQLTADDPALICRWAAGPNSMATVKILVDAAQLKGRTSIQSAVRVQVREPAVQTLVVPVEVTLK